MQNEIEPICKPHNNMMLIAEGCEDLPATKVRHRDGTPIIYTVWKCLSWKKRWKFLFTGEITLGVVTSTSQPPVSIIMGDALEGVEIVYQ